MAAAASIWFRVEMNRTSPVWVICSIRFEGIFNRCNNRECDAVNIPAQPAQCGAPFHRRVRVFLLPLAGGRGFFRTIKASPDG
jgi:hypothetical protein